jgi:hypothetical protein
MLTLALSLDVATAGELVWLHVRDGHGRPFDLQQLRGHVVALTFASRYTRDEAERVARALKPRVVAGDVEVVSVIDFAGVPSFLHGYVKRRVAEHDRGGMHYLIDEQGHLRRAFNVEPDKRVDIIVIDRAGATRGRFSGARQVDDALRLIDVLRASGLTW